MSKVQGGGGLGNDIRGEAVGKSYKVLPRNRGKGGGIQEC